MLPHARREWVDTALCAFAHATGLRPAG